MIEHTISFRPAFDDMVNGCAHEPKGDHGRTSVMVSFTTQDNGRGAVLEVSSGWHLPETYTKGLNIRGGFLDWNAVVAIRSAKISLHSPTPLFDNQDVSILDCKITGGPCYSDVAFVAADAVFEVLVRVGEEAFWAELDGWIPE